jgi:hypothetical protein
MKKLVVFLLVSFVGSITAGGRLQTLCSFNLTNDGASKIWVTQILDPNSDLIGSEEGGTLIASGNTARVSPQYIYVFEEQKVGVSEAVKKQKKIPGQPQLLGAWLSPAGFKKRFVIVQKKGATCSDTVLFSDIQKKKVPGLMITKITTD